MKNNEKAELRREVRDLSKKGYTRKEAIKILVDYGYCESTARMYWKIYVEEFLILEDKAK